jgi:hypothetical protein
VAALRAGLFLALRRLFRIGTRLCVSIADFVARRS